MSGELKNIIQKARELLNDAKEDEARELISANREVAKLSRDADSHRELADISEEIGLTDDLIFQLNLAIRDLTEYQSQDAEVSPEQRNDALDKHIELHKRLAEIHRDNGNLAKAMKNWQKIIDLRPAAAPASDYKELGAVLEEMKDYDAAMTLYKQALEKTGDDSFNALIRGLGFLEEAGSDQLRAAPPTDQGAALLPSDTHLVRFLRLFSGRDGLYARQWVSPTGQTGYTPITEPFTMAVAKNHILANYTVGLYQLRADLTVSFIAFDIDMPKFVLSRSITDEKAWNASMQKIHNTACAIVDAGAAHGVPVYIVDSGFKGRHCWIFLQSPITARIAKRFAVALLSQLKPTNDVHIEIFPKQTFLRGKGFGNLIKLPLGIHRKTGRRSLFLNPDGEPIADQLNLLDDLKTVSKEVIYELIRRVRPEDESEQSADRQAAGYVATGSLPVASDNEQTPNDAPSAAIPQEQYDIQRDASFQYLLLKCEALKTIVEKINRESELTSEERIVLTHTVGHLENGVEAVNALLQGCVNVDASFLLKSRIKGNPISCPKIRSRISDITSQVNCNCQFDPNIDTYPTPIIHVRLMDPKSSAQLLGRTVESLHFQNLLQEYVKLRKQLNEMETLRSVYEKRLHDLFEQAGIESMRTPLGTLKLVKDDEGESSYRLEL